MEEYWNLFLNWLNSLGELNQQRNIMPLAPRAEDRYANSFRINSDDPWFSNNINYNQNSEKAGVFQEAPYSMSPAYITREIQRDDTLYRESPEYKKASFVIAKKRTATNKDKNKNEYNTLKKRFNTAWKLAKPKK